VLHTQRQIRLIRKKVESRASLFSTRRPFAFSEVLREPSPLPFGHWYTHENHPASVLIAAALAQNNCRAFECANNGWLRGGESMEIP
jgi:hypothetical protein